MHRAYRWISISYKLYGFIPPHQSLSRQLPPEGKPSVGSASLIMRASNFNPSKNILQKSKSALQKASPNEKVTHHSLPLQGGRKLQAV